MKNSNLLPLFLSIAIVQTIIIGLLFFEIEVLNRNLQEARDDSPTSDSSVPVATKSNFVNREDTNKNLNNAWFQDNQTQLKQIVRETIREELADYFQDNQLLSAENVRLDNQRNLPKINHHPELLEQFTQDIESFVSQGGISNYAMEKLHSDIAQLNPNEQRQILSRLAKEINSGRIKIAQ